MESKEAMKCPTKLLDATALAEFLEISHPTALGLMKDPLFPAVMVCGRRKVAFGALMEYLKCQKAS
jgi:predicted DNA-binding transcriptional regulator AlpA